MKFAARIVLYTLKYYTPYTAAPCVTYWPAPGVPFP